MEMLCGTVLSLFNASAELEQSPEWFYWLMAVPRYSDYHWMPFLSARTGIARLRNKAPAVAGGQDLRNEEMF